MMTRIKVLPAEIAQQIAAGEVIERPASVVKELVENSVDAQATQIVVEIRGGGTESIRVQDNGVGIAKDELVLAFQPHATSKIESAEDLFALFTLGFRGEALPSMASAAKYGWCPARKSKSTPIKSDRPSQILNQNLLVPRWARRLRLQNSFTTSRPPQVSQI